LIKACRFLKFSRFSESIYASEKCWFKVVCTSCLYLKMWPKPAESLVLPFLSKTI
jgi:hypothetical protein